MNNFRRTLIVLLAICVVGVMAVGCSTSGTETSASSGASAEASTETSESASAEASAEESASEEASTEASEEASTDSGAASGATDIAILVPNADHGWTGAVVTYAEEAAKEVNDGGKYTAQVMTSTDASNQISQLEDLIENKTAKTVVILPQDNTLDAAMKRLQDSGIPYVMFDRIIDSVSTGSISNVKGDNEGIGKAAAKRFIDNDELQPGDNILIMPGDNSSVPEMRNNGFFQELLDNGWTQEQVDAISSTAYTGWSRSEGKRLFTEWIDTLTADEIAQWKYIYTHDDEIAMGILEALQSSDINEEKKQAFLDAGVNIGAVGGMNEFYSVLKGIHQRDYTDTIDKLHDLFTVTYDPAMIKIAVQDMVDSLDGQTVQQDHVVPVDVVDASNVDQFQGFGDAVSA